MTNIYIIGHKNPDTDSIASSVSYAVLKNKLDPSNKYIPARCGNANNQTKYIFTRNNVPLPMLLKDVYTKVADIMTVNVIHVNENDPVINVFDPLLNGHMLVLPVVDNKDKLKGLISFKELIKLIIQKDIDQRPRYIFSTEDISKVIKGKVIKRGDAKEFKAAIMVGAMPADKSNERIEKAGANETLLIVGNRKDVLAYAIEKQVPAIIITGAKENDAIDADFSTYKGWVYFSSLDSAETIRRVMLSSPVYSIMSESLETLSKDDYLDEAKDKIMNGDQRALPVVDSNNILIGIVTRSDLLRKHKTKLILMDHNEPDQAVDGVETADVLEIIDHHRLGAVKTTAPLTFYAKPVGSTCTLVYQLYKAAHIVPEKPIAMLLMGGILSDTVMLKSPTVTDEDKAALNELEKISGEDARKYGMDIFKATDNLSARTPESIVNTDFKKYSEFGVSFGVSQVEVVTLGDLDEVKDKLLAELERQKALNRLDWAMLLITDIIKDESILLTTNYPSAEKLLAYRGEEHCFNLPGVLSRKKQLLPEILRVLEELKKK